MGEGQEKGKGERSSRVGALSLRRNIYHSLKACGLVWKIPVRAACGGLWWLAPFFFFFNSHLEVDSKSNRFSGM